VEAAHFACRFDDQSRRFYDRKKQQTNPIIATKALACKLAKAAWHVMAGDVPYDAGRVFGPGKKAALGESRREPAKGSGRPSQKNWMEPAGLPASQPGVGPGDKRFYGDSTEPWVNARLDAPPESGASHQSMPLNEHGWALNAFWLPADREEGVREAKANAFTSQSDAAPGILGPRWNQMGDWTDRRPGGRQASESKSRNDRNESRRERRLHSRTKTKTAFEEKAF
jgi:hypothetical protein